MAINLYLKAAENIGSLSASKKVSAKVESIFADIGTSFWLMKKKRIVACRQTWISTKGRTCNATLDHRGYLVLSNLQSLFTAIMRCYLQYHSCLAQGWQSLVLATATSEPASAWTGMRLLSAVELPAWLFPPEPLLVPTEQRSPQPGWDLPQTLRRVFHEAGQ